jgi:hypothetical protein
MVLHELVGVIANDSFYLKTNYHFLIFIDSESNEVVPLFELQIKDLRIESNYTHYTIIQEEPLNITITLEYIDIVDMPTEPYAYVGFVLIQEIRVFVDLIFLFLGVLLVLLCKIYLSNKTEAMKESREYETFVEANGYLINFEVFISYEELISCLVITANGIQLLQVVCHFPIPPDNRPRLPASLHRLRPVHQPGRQGSASIPAVFMYELPSYD